MKKENSMGEKGKALPIEKAYHVSEDIKKLENFDW
jgi:hypothetical protein